MTSPAEIEFDEAAGTWQIDGVDAHLSDVLVATDGLVARDAVDRHLEGINVLLNRLLANDGDPDELSDQVAALATDLAEMTVPMMMNSHEVADHAGVEHSSLYVYRRRGQVPQPAAKVGVSDLWDRRTVLRWVAERETRVASPAA